MAYQKKNYVVEVHFYDRPPHGGQPARVVDVMVKDYGPDAACAGRAIGRIKWMLDAGLIREARVWHGGKVTAVHECSK